MHRSSLQRVLFFTLLLPLYLQPGFAGASKAKVQTLSSDAFYDDGSVISWTGSGWVPSSKLWINTGADIQSGDTFTNNPPPPQGIVVDARDSTLPISNPVLHLSRRINGAEPSSYPGGASVVSVPIDLSAAHHAVLSFMLHRAMKRDQYSRGWSDSILVGPEVRVIRNMDPYSEAPGRNGTLGADELQVDFACTNDDGTRNIFDDSSAKEVSWTIHPVNSGNTPITGNPALTVFGGGGTRRGYSETDYNMALNAHDGLRSNVYDDGKDVQWQFIQIMIPDTFLHAPQGASKNFRVRLHVAAYNNGVAPVLVDDDDDFYIKNVRVTDLDSSINLAGLNCKFAWPYQSAQPDVLGALSCSVSIVNTGLKKSGAVAVQLSIVDSLTKEVQYVKQMTLPFAVALLKVEIPFSVWDARSYAQTHGSQNGTPVLVQCTISTENDADTLDNKWTNIQHIAIAPFCSYTDLHDRSDVYSYAHKYFGLNQSTIGLSTSGYVIPGFTANSAFGDIAGSGPGEIALEVPINEVNSGSMEIRGFQVYFDNELAASTEFEIRCYYADGAGDSPGDLIGRSVLRGVVNYDTRTGQKVVDANSTYMYPDKARPVLSSAGSTIWVGITQLSSTSTNLGASAKRSGFQITNVDDINDGMYNINLNLDKNFRKYNRQGQYVNASRTAFRNGVDSLDWVSMDATSGNLGYAHLDFAGTVKSIPTYTRGSWLPMIYPQFGPISATSDVRSAEGSEATISYIESCAPLPAQTYARITVLNKITGFSRVEIVDMEGVTVETLLNRSLECGETIVVWNCATQPSGTYFCRFVDASGRSSVYPLVVSH